MSHNPIVLGATAEIGAVFRNAAGALTSPSSVTVKIRDADGVDITPDLTDADAEVTIGTTLQTDLATSLKLTAAENTAGTGIVACRYAPATAGRWRFFITDDGDAANHVSIYVEPEFE